MNTDNNCLEGKLVAVLVETEYIHDEIEYYRYFFESNGARVDFMTNLNGKKSRKIICDITNVDNPEKDIHTMTVDIDIADCNSNDYAIVLVAANYVACRLREIPPMGSLGGIDQLASPPAVRFFAQAMENKQIVKGALCHGLWLLTPVPELLKGRNVICHTVVLADIYNAGANYIKDSRCVVIDDDLVTGRAYDNVNDYTYAILETYKRIEKFK